MRQLSLGLDLFGGAEVGIPRAPSHDITRPAGLAPYIGAVKPLFGRRFAG